MIRTSRGSSDENPVGLVLLKKSVKRVFGKGGPVMDLILGLNSYILRNPFALEVKSSAFMLCPKTINKITELRFF